MGSGGLAAVGTPISAMRSSIKTQAMDRTKAKKQHADGLSTAARRWCSPCPSRGVGRGGEGQEGKQQGRARDPAQEQRQQEGDAVDVLQISVLLDAAPTRRALITLHNRVRARCKERRPATQSLQPDTSSTERDPDRVAVARHAATSSRCSKKYHGSAADSAASRPVATLPPPGPGPGETRGALPLGGLVEDVGRHVVDVVGAKLVAERRHGALAVRHLSLYGGGVVAARQVLLDGRLPQGLLRHHAVVPARVARRAVAQEDALAWLTGPPPAPAARPSRRPSARGRPQ
ncbi:unnamed protein product [Prorocentrum cordatum]|uniref:Uncharacterized protein n=1 Tax=Prorocentrum cordatum TaxID=2364126 RepID=A0ABN9W511_9DINO|nr:unnamed protein product [Polarella glacialis]